MTRRRLAAAAALVWVLLAAPPASAIETTRFGIGPGDGDSFDVPLRPGRTTTASFDLWNKQDRPLTLRLHLSPATIAADGSVTLEGPAAPVGWASVPDEVTLRPGERRAVELELSSPRQLPVGIRTMAVVAEPALADGAPAPAVLQRLALVAHLERAGRDLPDLWPAAAVAIAAIVAVFALSVVSRRRRSDGSRSR